MSPRLYYPAEEPHDMPDPRVPAEDHLAVSWTLLEMSGLRHHPPEIPPTLSDPPIRPAQSGPSTMKTYWPLVRFILKGLGWTVVALFLYGLVTG